MIGILVYAKKGRLAGLTRLEQVGWVSGIVLFVTGFITWVFGSIPNNIKFIIALPMSLLILIAAVWPEPTYSSSRSRTAVFWDRFLLAIAVISLVNYSALFYFALFDDSFLNAFGGPIITTQSQDIVITGAFMAFSVVFFLAVLRVYLRSSMRI